MSKKLLVTGSSKLVGFEVCRFFAGRGFMAKSLDQAIGGIVDSWRRHMSD